LAAETTIFYFTATGNSLKVARDLADQLGDAELVSIPRTADAAVGAQSEATGVVFPTYFGGLPLIVRRFLETWQPAPYVFAITTCGGMAGGSLKQMARMLRSRGTVLSAGFAVNMPGNYARLYGANPPERQQRYFATEQGRIEAIAETVRQRQTGPIESSFFLPSWGLALLYRFYFAAGAARQDGIFWADENCNGCGVCCQVCPVANIELRDARPAWLHHCEQCYACLQWCPQEAIQANRKTPLRQRYRNPGVALKDIIASNSRTAPPGSAAGEKSG
jgi:flavodoxin/ferredoxin